MSPFLLLLAIVAPSAPDLGAYGIEPWSSPDTGLFFKALDSAASKGQRLVISCLWRDSAGGITSLDTAFLTSFAGGFQMEQRLHDFEENSRSLHVNWYTRDGMIVDSGSESRWIKGVLVSQASATTTWDGTSRRSFHVW